MQSHLSNPSAQILALLLLAPSLWACGAPPRLGPPELPATPPSAASATVRRVVTPPAPVQQSPKVTVLALSEGHPYTSRFGVRAGDFVLQSKGLRAVVAGPGHVGPAGEGGHLVALWTTDDAPPDFGDASPVFDPDGAQGLSKARFEVVATGAARGVLRVTGQVAGDDDLRVTLEYSLDAEAANLDASLTVENKAPGRHPSFSPGWFVRWGRLVPFVPETRGDLRAQRTDADWVGGTTASTALMFAWDAGRVFARHGSGWSTLSSAVRTLGPRELRQTTARFRLGGAQGLGPLSLAELETRGAVSQTVRGTVVDAEGAPLPDATVYLMDRLGRALTRDRTDAQGAFTLRARPGDGRQLNVSAGLGEPTAPVPAPEGETPVRLRGPAVGQVTVQVVDGDDRPLPAQVRVLPEGAPEDGHDPDAETFAMAGEATFTLRPGTWRVQAVGGPERPRPSARVVVQEGERAQLRLRLPRIFEAEGWRALDAHLALAPGGAGLDRLRSCAALGVEAVVAPGEGALNAADGAAAILPAARVAVGDQALFAAWGAQGRQPWTGQAAEILARLKQKGRWRAVLRPRSPGAGYFAKFGYLSPSQPVPLGGFSLDFDALEVGGPDSAASLDRLGADWLALRRSGHPVVALGGSAGDNAAECGASRVWVWHPEALDGDSAWRSALRRAPTCVSNGPRTRLTWTAAGALKVRVQAAPQHRPLRVVIEGPKGELRRVELPTGDGALDFERDVTVSAGVSWAAARTEGAAPGALDAAAGWSITGIVRRGSAAEVGRSTD